MRRLRLDQSAIDALKVFGLIIEEDRALGVNYAAGSDIKICVYRSDEGFYEFLLELELPNGSALGIPVPRRVFEVNAEREFDLTERQRSRRRRR